MCQVLGTRIHHTPCIPCRLFQHFLCWNSAPAVSSPSVAASFLSWFCNVPRVSFRSRGLGLCTASLVIVCLRWFQHRCLTRHVVTRCPLLGGSSCYVQIRRH